jgi:hypothetical protein
VGLTLTSLAPGNEGKAIWNYDGSGTALYTMTWDSKYAYWFTTAPNESHVVLDASTGKVVRTQSLILAGRELGRVGGPGPRKRASAVARRRWA